MLKLSRILLPVDFSEQGKAATRYAAALARHLHAALTLLHVNEIYSRALVAPEEFHGPIDTGWITALELERLREIASCQEAELGDLNVQRLVVSGDPAQRDRGARPHREGRPDRDAHAWPRAVPAVPARLGDGHGAARRPVSRMDRSAYAAFAARPDRREQRAVRD